MRCSKCVLSDKAPNIVFDQDGVCNYCHTYPKFSYKGEAELIKTLDSFRRPDSKYDCVVGLSGGRDSSYLLLKLVKDYGMKVLAVNYENPFTVPQAKKNIENALKALNVDIVHFQDKNNRHKRVFRDTVRAWFKRPSPALIPIVCIGCKPAWIEIYRIAKKHDIHCVASGGNPFEVISFKRELVGIERDQDARSAFFKYIYSLREIIKNMGYFTPGVVLTLMKSYLFGNPFSLGIRLFYPDLTWVEMFNYIEWNEQEILSRIRNELGWEGPANIKSTWRFDCRVKHLVDLMYVKTLGLTDKDDFYAKVVREGLMDRADALERLEKENALYPDEIRTLLEQAGIRDPSIWEQVEKTRLADEVVTAL
ncbi:MAG: ATPase [Anaerolineae bacterium]|nr:ATPase [Anaerolineae bacterium]